jgi:hypothetical protein
MTLVYGCRDRGSCALAAKKKVSARTETGGFYLMADVSKSESLTQPALGFSPRMKRS